MMVLKGVRDHIFARLRHSSSNGMIFDSGYGVTLTSFPRFMQSDPWWSLAMAINVFPVFFCNADPRMFRKYAWLYCIICFGGPMIPAIVLISIRNSPKGLMYGDAAVSSQSSKCLFAN